MVGQHLDGGRQGLAVAGLHHAVEGVVNDGLDVVGLPLVDRVVVFNDRVVRDNGGEPRDNQLVHLYVVELPAGVLLLDSARGGNEVIGQHLDGGRQGLAVAGLLDAVEVVGNDGGKALRLPLVDHKLCIIGSSLSPYSIVCLRRHVRGLRRDLLCTSFI